MMEYRYAQSYLIGKWLVQMRVKGESDAAWTYFPAMPAGSIHGEFAVSHEQATILIKEHKAKGMTEAIWDSLPRHVRYVE